MTDCCSFPRERCTDTPRDAVSSSLLSPASLPLEIRLVHTRDHHTADTRTAGAHKVPNRNGRAAHANCAGADPSALLVWLCVQSWKMHTRPGAQCVCSTLGILVCGCVQCSVQMLTRSNAPVHYHSCAMDECAPGSFAQPLSRERCRRPTSQTRRSCQRPTSSTTT